MESSQVSIYGFCEKAQEVFRTVLFKGTAMQIM